MFLCLNRFAFVEYVSHRAAAMARRKLMNGRIQLWNHVIAVDWAEPELKVDEEIMAKVGRERGKRERERERERENRTKLICVVPICHLVSVSAALVVTFPLFS